MNLFHVYQMFQKFENYWCFKILLMKVEKCRLHRKDGNDVGLFVKKPKRIGSIGYILDYLMALQFGRYIKVSGGV